MREMREWRGRARVSQETELSERYIAGYNEDEEEDRARDVVSCTESKSGRRESGTKDYLPYIHLTHS